GLAGADQAVVRPHRNAPLPFLDDFGIRFLHQSAQPAEHLAPPVAELLDSRVDPLGRRLAALLTGALVHVQLRSPSSGYYPTWASEYPNVRYGSKAVIDCLYFPTRKRLAPSQSVAPCK